MKTALKLGALGVLVALPIARSLAQSDSTPEARRPIIAPPIIEPPIWPPRPIPPMPREEELKLETQNARVEISGALAKTKLTQTFRNQTNRTVEGTYLMPLPEGAALSGFAMTVNGKRVESEILDRDKARQIYEDIVRQMRDPGILEFVDRGLIKARIFPIAPRAEQTVEIEYSQTLRGEGASAFRYSLPQKLPVGGAPERSSVDIILKNNDVRAAYSPTHEVQTSRTSSETRVSGEWKSSTQNARDFALVYTLSSERIGLNLMTYQPPGEDPFFMLLAAPDPKLSTQEIAAKDVVFVFDTSGSMAEDGKIEQARRALQTLLGTLNPDDKFGIVTFSSDVRPFRDSLQSATKANLDAARSFAKDIKAVGGTNINDALVEALKMLPKSGSRPQQIVFMTDGLPTVGETSVDEILKNVSQNASTQKTRVFAFGVGYDVNTRLLDTIADETRGSSDYVTPGEDIETQVGSLGGKIAYPVLSDVKLNWRFAEAYDIYPRRLPDLFKGTQTVVFGRLKGNGITRIVDVNLSGIMNGQLQTIRSEISTGDALGEVLPRLWATRKIGFLLDDSRKNGATINPEVRDEIIALSKKYGVVSPLTAGLITEDTPAAPGSPIMRQRAAAPSFNAGLAQESGRDAVTAAKSVGRMRKAQSVQQNEAPRDASTRFVEGKNFVLKNGIWTDSTFDASKSPKIETVKFASPEYFALAKDAKIAKWLSVGERVIVVLPGRVIKIEP